MMISFMFNESGESDIVVIAVLVGIILAIALSIPEIIELAK